MTSRHSSNRAVALYVASVRERLDGFGRRGIDWSTLMDRPFRVRPQPMPDGTWRAYVEGLFGGLQASYGLPHVLPDAVGRHVCWSAPIRSARDAAAIGSLWAAKARRYVLYGEPF
jgi:hypothetical protein